MALHESKAVNANNVDLYVTSEEGGQILSTEKMVVDEFTIGTDSDMSALSGVGHHDTQKMSLGDVTHNFSFTVQGEEGTLYKNLARDDNGAPARLQLRARGEEFDISLDNAFSEAREYSASTGDTLEYQVSGMAVSVNEN